MCKVLGIARSSYYKYKNRIIPSKEKTDELLCSLIHEYHATFDGMTGFLVAAFGVTVDAPHVTAGSCRQT